jgi:endonuclease YncB( thermonuclease family)
MSNVRCAGSWNRRWAIVLVAAAATLLVTAEEPPMPELPAMSPPMLDGATRGKVIDVAAGHTLVVAGLDESGPTNVRLIGVYVPVAGEAAAQAALDRMLRGEPVLVRTEADWPLFDRADRLWAYVYRVPDHLYVNVELIRQGYGRLSARAPFPDQAAFRAYERRARKLGKGVWAPVTTQPTSQPAEAAAPVTKPVADPTQPPVTTTQPAAADVTVYITPSGKKYHRRECHFAGSDPFALTVAEAKRRGYEPCSHCNPPE